MLVNFKTELPLSVQEPIYLGLFADLHYGAIDCNHKLAQRRMRRYVDEFDAKLFILGDTLDLITKSDRKRYMPSRIPSNIASDDDQTTMMLDFAFEQLQPFAENIYMISMGNHETSKVKYSDINPLKLLVRELNLDLKSRGSTHRIMLGGYHGYWRFGLNVGGRKLAYRFLYDHGHGGGAPVTKGMIDINRIQTSYNYDLFAFGHKHTKISDRSVYHDVSQNGNTKVKSRLAVQVGSFQNVYDERALVASGRPGEATYMDSKGVGASPTGGTLVKIYCEYLNGDKNAIVGHEVTI
jgi:hypothetical protein